MKIVFFNIGWAAKYQGVEKITGGHRFLKENKYGSDVCNFKPYRNKLLAYVPVRGKQGKETIQLSLDISRLGATKNDDSVSNVTVIFIAKRTETDRFALIVGWYKNAIVYRNPKTLTGQQRFGKEWYSELGEKWTYYAEADKKDCFCVPPEARNFKIESAKTTKGGYGRSVWYADKKEAIKELDKLKSNILKYIDKNDNVNQIKSKTSRNSSSGRIQDFDERKKIEKTAVEETSNYYEANGYAVESVEKFGVGWDLTATLLDDELNIEVKGTKDNIPSFELTPNEYRKMKERCIQYRIAVVTSCLQSPKLHIYEILKKDDHYYGRDILDTTNFAWIEFQEKTDIYAVGKPTEKSNV